MEMRQGILESLQDSICVVLGIFLLFWDRARWYGPGMLTHRLILTGASGFIGRMLVPLLTAKGSELLLVGRDPERLARQFPHHRVCGYEGIESHGRGFDMLIHLAAINSDATAAEDEFESVNVDLLLSTAERARLAGIACFVNLSSTHAMEASGGSAYARSKRKGALRLREITGIRVTTLFLPAVYGDIWQGRLSLLNELPGWLKKAGFAFASALKPTLAVDRLAQYLCEITKEPLSSAYTEEVLSDGQQDNGVYQAWTRCLDLAGVLLIVALLWWLLILLWIAVRCQSEGPGIFAQVRVGRHGKQFTCYKFRTMRSGTEQVATHLVSAQVVTPLGKILRRTKLDELPQVWNIIKNEMSFIGPRPCLPSQTELIDARRMRGVLELKPGISGLAQVEGVDMSDPDRLARLDQQYGKLQSIFLDLKLVFATLRGKGQGDPAASSVS